MRRLLVGIVAAVALACASTASAATEIGDPCVGDDAAPFGFFQISSPSSPLPMAAPATGVVTQWKVNLVAAPVQIPQSLKIARIVSPTLVQTVAESSVQTVVGGANSFPTRLPIQAGDRLGLAGTGGEFGGLFCEDESTPSDHVGITESFGPPGGSVLYEDIPLRIPVRAVIEPDADNDGYGDETQDLCPQSAAFQVACPVVTLDAFPIVGGSAVKVLVATSTSAPVKVTGVAKLGKGAKAKLSTKSKTVSAGVFTTFKLSFSKALKEKLKELEPGKKLTLKITASATNVAGQVSADKLKAKLKGQG